ncbi:MAG TPA: hypothetical protein G4N96_04835 [Chloroflexi bacterium]|nr:hypothetical protein [Chloroflexota bacterium]
MTADRRRLTAERAVLRRSAVFRRRSFGKRQGLDAKIAVKSEGYMLVRSAISLQLSAVSYS